MDDATPSKLAASGSDTHQSLAEKIGVDRDGRTRPAPFSWIVPAIVSALVALLFFASLKPVEPWEATGPPLDGWADVTEVARAVRADLVTVLKAQVNTFGRIALFAAVPGLFGLIYRKRFWHWFLSAFVILFAVNLIGYRSGVASLSTGILSELNYPYIRYVAGEAGLLLLLVIFRLRRHVTLRDEERPSSPKNIVICLDGTWNHPGQTDWGHLAQTNVFKLFDSLRETEGAGGAHYNASRCKRYVVDGVERQVALYYNGVGNKVENSVLGEKIGGAFGLGAEAIKERAYVDAAREYQPGDRIFIFGFSRGAALARMVAATLDKRGVPRSLWTLRLFGRQRPVKTSDEHVPVEIAVLGCWDTVGAFGMPKDILGIPFQSVNLLKDLNVPLSVQRAYHLVALDEDRDSFVPTLMEPDPTDPSRIVEVWFSGNHSNVGGGFATDGLSDHTLSFMLDRVSSAWDRESHRTVDDTSWGLLMKPGRTFHPNPLGKLRHSGGPIYKRFPRPVPYGAAIHDSVFRRIRDQDSSYVPDSLFEANKVLYELRRRVAEEVAALQETRSIDEGEARDVERWVDRQLTLHKWSKLKPVLSTDPASELANT